MPNYFTPNLIFLIGELKDDLVSGCNVINGCIFCTNGMGCYEKLNITEVKWVGECDPVAGTVFVGVEEKNSARQERLVFE